MTSDCEFKAGNQRGDVECCQCVCPVGWTSLYEKEEFWSKLDEVVGSAHLSFWSREQR